MDSYANNFSPNAFHQKGVEITYHIRKYNFIQNPIERKRRILMLSKEIILLSPANSFHHWPFIIAHKKMGYI